MVARSQQLAAQPGCSRLIYAAYAAAFLAAAFPGADFLPAAFLTTTRPALFAAQRFFNAATMAALPAALNSRFGLAVALDIVSVPPFVAAGVE